MEIYCYLVLPSTQDLAKKLLEKKKPPFAVSALEQTQGYGKQGRAFYSPKNGLYLSVCLEKQENPLLTLAVGTAVADFLRARYGLEIGLKWANDLFYQGKKVAGILTEQVAGGIVVGLGLNLGAELPASLPQATRLLEAGDFDPLLADDLACVICRADQGRLLLEKGGKISAWSSGEVIKTSFL
ncbi:biotin--[acetyl-CoA-carboxylase] ligase [Lactobacillus delbrueckii subsp. lactis]|uniref:biotin--[acetyl-CoA-carboxylase] ligase n=1 Tax=Lactobacillus delbrueckii TaxID=1584 RepID=UPI0035D0F3CD